MKNGKAPKKGIINTEEAGMRVGYFIEKPTKERGLQILSPNIAETTPLPLNFPTCLWSPPQTLPMAACLLHTCEEADGG